MFIESQNHLIFELKNIRFAVKQKDGQTLNKTYDDLLNRTAIPKKEVVKEGYVTICSSQYSFHLLSVYFLLDVIDFYWDGHQFFDRDLKSSFSLMDELGIQEKTDEIRMETISRLVEKVNILLRDDIYVFLLPYRFKKDYSLKLAYPGNVLLLYHNPDVSIEDIFYEGIAEFYLKKKLKSSLPYWAKNHDFFKKEFIKWCKNEKSLFKS